MKTAGDHEMDHDEQLAVQLENDSLSEPFDAHDVLADQVGEWWVDGSEEEGRLEAHFVDGLPDDALAQRLDVDGDVGQLRQRGASWRKSLAEYAPRCGGGQRF